jgi:acetyl-CoA acetyltransferase
MALEIPIIVGVADIVNRSLSPADAREPAALMLEAVHAALADAFIQTSPEAGGDTKADSEKEKEEDARDEKKEEKKKDALRAAVDSIDVVRTWTWPYADLPGLLCEKLGLGIGEREVKWKRYSEHGGDKPGKMVDEAARRIARGECSVAVVVGGEALASCMWVVSLV